MAARFQGRAVLKKRPPCLQVYINKYICDVGERRMVKVTLMNLGRNGELVENWRKCNPELKELR